MNTNDYSFQIIADQHRQDLFAEAANDRLARLATADRAPLWRRILHRHGRAPSPPSRSRLTGAHGSLSAPCRTAGQPRWHDGAYGVRHAATAGARTPTTSSAGRSSATSCAESSTTSIDDGSRFVIVGGDAGAGKTTVIEAFVADLGSTRWPTARRN